MTAPFFVTDGHVSPSKPSIQFLSVRERIKVRLISAVFKVVTHWVDGKSIPHLLNGECSHCDLPKRWTGYADVTTANAGGTVAEHRILIVPEGSLGLFGKELKGQVLTLNRMQEGRVSRLIIERRDAPDLPMPAGIDVIATLRAWWRGVEIDFSTASNLAAEIDAPQLRSSEGGAQ